MNKQIPKEAHLYWVATAGAGFLTMHNNKSLERCKGYTWLGSAPVDFGDVFFDEKTMMLKALKEELGEAQGKVNYIKERIQELLAIGYDKEEVWPGGVDTEGNFSRVD